jgi:hypothetical protein
VHGSADYGPVLDEFLPRYDVNEMHSIAIAAEPARRSFGRCRRVVHSGSALIRMARLRAIRRRAERRRA